VSVKMMVIQNNCTQNVKQIAFCLDSVVNAAISCRCSLSAFAPVTVCMHRQISASASPSCVPVSAVVTLPRTLQNWAREEHTHTHTDNIA